MRLMLVGSGQVSNYEQDLMQRLSGGSIKTSREAAKLLFEYYASESRHVVAAYNKAIDDLSIELPDVKKAHGYVGKRSGIDGGGGGNPKVGEIKKGYRFKGGNPADPKNYEKVK
jgi:hypothetical protein